MSNEPVLTHGLYAVLGVAKEASSLEIKNAYKIKALLFHPDKASGGEKQFDEIRKAYMVLSNKKTRWLYDLCGDGIVPILNEDRYSVYIDCFLSRDAFGATVAMGLLVALNVCFYPHLAMARIYGYLPCWWITLAPVAAAWAMFLGVVLKLMGMLRKKGMFVADMRNIGVILIKSFFVLLFAATYLFSMDGYLGRLVPLGTCLAGEAFFFFAEVRKAALEAQSMYSGEELGLGGAAKLFFRRDLFMNFLLRVFLAGALLARGAPLWAKFAPALSYFPLNTLIGEVRLAVSVSASIFLYPYAFTLYIILAKQMFIFSVVCLVLIAIVSLSLIGGFIVRSTFPTPCIASPLPQLMIASNPQVGRAHRTDYSM